MVCQRINLRKVKCISQYRLATVDCVSAERARDARKASEFLARALSTILWRSDVEVFFVLISGILLKFKLEIWTRMCKLASECKYHFVLLEIMSFSSLKTCSFGAKLIVGSKWCFACYFHFSNASKAFRNHF